MTDDRVVIIEADLLSDRETVDDGLSSLKVQGWNTGEVTLTWTTKGEVVEQVNFCINAYFNLMTMIPQLFGEIGEPLVHTSCDINTALIIVHDDDRPEIIFGVVREGVPDPLSLVTLKRGRALILLDKVATRLASLDQTSGCNAPETSTEIAANDPFAGIDDSVRH
ncbi:unnamed protein product [Sphagnum tenellum]